MKIKNKAMIELEKALARGPRPGTKPLKKKPLKKVKK